LKWLENDVILLRENYPIMGYRVCELFPERTKASVLRKAQMLNLKVKRKLRKELMEDRVGYLDIETSQLVADFGICYSWCIKEAGKEHYEQSTITRQELLDGTLDKRVIEELVDAMRHYTLLYTYYGSRFDVPFVRTRALMHEIPFIPRGEIEHRDLYYLARRVLRVHSNRLENVCAVLGIKGKTRIEQRYWILANTGEPEAIRYIAEHNRADVTILEKVHERLAEFEAQQRRWL